MGWLNSRVAALTVCMVVVSDAAAGPAETTYSLGDAGELHVTLPAGWKGTTDGRTLTTVELRAPAGKHASVQLTPVPGKTADAELKRAAMLVGRRYAAGSKEKKTTLIEVKGDGVSGYVSAYTDASDDPGEFRYVTAGVLGCGNQAMAVTVLYNDKQGPEQAAAMDALKTLSVKAPGGDGGDKAKPADGKGLRATSPDGKWTLVLPGDWQVDENEKSGNSRRVTATSADGSLILSLFLEPAGGTGDARAARAFYLKRMQRNPIPMRNQKQDVVGDVATLEYDQGPAELKQHHLNAYLAHDGVWVDVHVSKVMYDEKADRAAIDALVKGIAVEPAGEE